MNSQHEDFEAIRALTVNVGTCPFCQENDNYVERINLSSCAVICDCGVQGPPKEPEDDADLEYEEKHGLNPGHAAAVRAWQAERAQRGEPDGWQLVPLDATEHSELMDRAMEYHYDWNGFAGRSEIVQAAMAVAYAARDMAAPKPQEQPVNIQSQVDPIYIEIAEERAQQDVKWGGSGHDDEHSPFFWCQLIQDYAGWARVMAGMDNPTKYRRRMMQIATLAVAAAQSHDRLIAQGQKEESSPKIPVNEESPVRDAKTGCHAGRDGECSWEGCPQIRDNEPESNGRHCPLDRGDTYQ